MRDVIDDIKEAFLTGVSYMLPFVVAGSNDLIAFGNGIFFNAFTKYPAIRSLLPTLIIPVVGCAAICLLMHYVIGGPLGALTQALTKLLNDLGTGNLILLGIVQGCMLAFDMGGPCNKVAYAFALACMETGNYAPMAANFVACCAPPLAVALAMLIVPKKFTDEEWKYFIHSEYYEYTTMRCTDRNSP